MRTVIRAPSAWLPLALSAIALAMIVAHVAAFGVVSAPGADEGAPARLFQLVMAGDAVVIAWFAFRWLPTRPRSAVPILALQVVAFALPIVLIAILES